MEYLKPILLLAGVKVIYGVGRAIWMLNKWYAFLSSEEYLP